MRMSHIVCPVDFSESTQVGVQLASALARRFSARVTLLHVLPALPAPFRVPVDTEELYDQWDREARDRLREVLAAVRGQGVAASQRLTRGSAYHEIADLAEEEEADLVVLPTHRHAGLDRLLYGSVAERVVRVSRTPVLTAPPTLEIGNDYRPAKVLVATDFSRAAEAAFEAAVDVAEDFSAELVITHVFTFEHLSDSGAEWWRPTLTHEQIEEAVANVTRRLDRLAERARRQGLDARGEILQGANPAVEIVRFIEEEGAELVVAAKQGSGFLRHLLLGSTAEKLVRSCPVPLLTVPPPADEPAEGTLPDPVPA